MPTLADTDQQSDSVKHSSQVKTTPSLWKIAGITILCGILAGIGGAALFGWYTSHYPTTRLGSTSSKNVVVSEQNATIDIAKKVGPSVVSITTSATGSDIFGNTTSQQAAGTGIIVSSDGYILTNKHVVSNGSSFVVVTSEGKQYKQVKLVAQDPTNDIAFLKIDGVSGLTPAEIGDSSKVEVGSFVVAIGNALGQFQNTVTTGVISGKGRPVTAAAGNSAETLQDLFQTDAAINPGNSGGPLVNIEGQVIGINTAVAGQGSENIGFAIPINEAKRDIETVLSSGKISRAYLGVRYVTITPDIAQANGLSKDYGAYIKGSQNSSGVQSSSPAAKAGLKDGDIILKVNDTTIDSNNSLSSVLAQYTPGTTVTLMVYRDGKEQQIKATLAEAPTS